MSVRKTYAPYSTSGENVAQTPLTGFIDIKQEVIPTIETGFVNENGLWIGNTSSDEEFGFYHRGNAIPNGEVELASTCDMTGFKDFQLAIRPSNGGNFGIVAVMGPDTNKYANLSPVNAATVLRGNYKEDGTMADLLNDSAEALTANVWNIFMVNAGKLANQKLLQFKITNNSGGDSDIEVMYLRIV